MRDMAFTRDEVVGLMDGLLTSGEPPTGTTRLSRLAGRERGRPRETVRVRAAAQLPRVVAIGTRRVSGCAILSGLLDNIAQRRGDRIE